MSRDDGDTRSGVVAFPVQPVRGQGHGLRGSEPPKGKLEEVVTYLQMTAATPAPARPGRSEKLALMRAEKPTVAFYRFLYDTVGGQWMWHERRRMSDEKLAAIIRDPLVEIDVLYVAGVPAGYIELDRRVSGEVELAYFGLAPDFIGRGLGSYLLAWGSNKAWRRGVRRVWVHTCNFDHPRAIAVYQRAGFVPYKQETNLIDDPRADGTLPPPT